MELTYDAKTLIEWLAEATLKQLCQVEALARAEIELRRMNQRRQEMEVIHQVGREALEEIRR